MYTLNIGRATKHMTINEIKDFIFENYCKQIGFLRTMQVLRMLKFQILLTLNCN